MDAVGWFGLGMCTGAAGSLFLGWILSIIMTARPALSPDEARLLTLAETEREERAS